MFLLSQDETLIVEMCGVYIKNTIRHKKEESGLPLLAFNIDEEVYQIYCISKGILEYNAKTREYILGEFRSMERAIKEVRDISCALSKGNIVYEIKQDE